MTQVLVYVLVVCVKPKFLCPPHSILLGLGQFLTYILFLCQVNAESRSSMWDQATPGASCLIQQAQHASAPQKWSETEMKMSKNTGQYAHVATTYHISSSGQTGCCDKWQFDLFIFFSKKRKQSRLAWWWFLVIFTTTKLQNMPKYILDFWHICSLLLSLLPWLSSEMLFVLVCQSCCCQGTPDNVYNNSGEGTNCQIQPLKSLFANTRGLTFQGNEAHFQYNRKTSLYQWRWWWPWWVALV